MRAGLLVIALLTRWPAMQDMQGLFVHPRRQVQWPIWGQQRGLEHMRHHGITGRGAGLFEDGEILASGGGTAAVTRFARSVPQQWMAKLLLHNLKPVSKRQKINDVTSAAIPAVTPIR